MQKTNNDLIRSVCIQMESTNTRINYILEKVVKTNFLWPRKLCCVAFCR